MTKEGKNRLLEPGTGKYRLIHRAHERLQPPYGPKSVKIAIGNDDPEEGRYLFGIRGYGTQFILADGNNDALPDLWEQSGYTLKPNGEVVPGNVSGEWYVAADVSEKIR